MTTQITKTLQPSKDVYIQFTEDEILEMGIQSGDKFDVEILPDEDGFILKKRQPIEINLDEWDVETLRRLVGESLEKDLPVNEIIVQALKEFLKNDFDEIGD